MTARADADLREAVCRVGASLFARGHAHATAGNISVRTGDGFVITPTDACLGTLDPARLAVVTADGRQTAGDRASKTLALHRRIYDADPDARCILHTHATHCVALTLAAGADRADGADLLPPITPYFVMKVGHVPLIGYHRPGDPAAGDAVVERIVAMRERGTQIRAVMLERLGPVVWHRSPDEAAAVLEELEETAKLWWMTRPTPLDDERIAELRAHFGASW